METDIQRPLKRFPYSSLSSLIQTGWCEERHLATRNSLQYSHELHIADGDFSTSEVVVELNLVKCRKRFGCLPWGRRLFLA